MNRNFPEVKGALGFGCMRLPMEGEQVDAAQFAQMVDEFLAHGFNYFDTALEQAEALRQSILKKAFEGRLR